MRRIPNMDNLVVCPWTSITDRPDLTQHFFDNIYVVNQTNANFMFQKILRSHMGTKSILPDNTSLALFAPGQSFMFSIVEKRKDKYIPIAVACACHIDYHNATAEIKLVIDPRLYGRGYTRPVLHSFVKYLFDIALLNSLELRLVKVNETYATANSIMKVPGVKRVGMLERYIEVRGRLKPVYLYQFTLERYLSETEVVEEDTETEEVASGGD